MVFQKSVDSLFSPACIVSVEKKEDGGYGDIRIVTANRKYADILSTREMPEEHQM